ncbi:bifunctional diaminohydroxyphosphoribosylaminopyrimidine deaminase/5-amino-6-(5-phosphoribosylamino)uracil reductase RibD [Fimbriimonas ginsengisoli]|uniref:Riboflavin biosynthesis protein RibD n=1 Tax=Fimbriimonas ginsengisoli Gsoil 348 TaxID=661478 RepID=A0A068NQY0_FIMGI|nr:bifunctional diaminohydroxyphosphoribosylaminopyrimidine deaminase/5-amino-6-(5-phosphoribosylamino)uracil reductase RibD [Fimbriimonas ginsengisoli]AIE85787.1 riboflavin biosynthesis protein RibD [Fimbriimonas ginsengisoli Gsoil 348]
MAKTPTPDERLMRRAIALSRRGFPAPNPHVGCVLVRDGEIVGEGYHHHAGAPHAEAAALSVAGERARGADAYVTLEPCNHFGRTPPCTDALLRAGVRRVVAACPDPNPVASGGLARLAENGVATEIGLLQQEAEAANFRFLSAMRMRRPHVTIKAAVSLDGRIALPSGESQWITGPAARREGHRLRAECGAVLVGRRTVEMDDPQLTARIPGVVNQPLRIVLDPRGRLTGKERVFDAAAPTKHVTGPVDLNELLVELFNDGVTSLLVEGGGTTIAGFVRSRLADAVELFLAPKLLGDGPSWLNGLDLGNLAEAPSLEIDRIKRLGPDLRLSAHVRYRS